MVERGHKKSELQAGSVEEILDEYRAACEQGCFKSNEEIAREGYDLLPARNFGDAIEVPNVVSFGELICDVTRGAALGSNELTELITKEKTPYQYLMLSHIVDGKISDSLPFLTDIDDSLARYCIESGDLLLSKNGAPYKIAVAEVPEGQNILANGNLFVIRVNRNLVSPAYVAAFLNSPTGRALLARSATGTALPNLSLTALRKIPIPLLPREAQERIATRYMAKLDEIQVLKYRLEKARAQASSIFEEEA